MKKIVKIFNNFIKRTIFKVENKTNDKFHVSNFSKYIITVIVVLFVYIFYLSIPLLYDKTWVQNKIVTKLSDEFNINLSNSFDISYRILPKPHYLIRDSKTALAEIKVLNVFISQNNLFNKNSIRINKVVIEEANFSLLKDNFKTLYENSENKFSKKKIKINNSNIFLKDNILLESKITQNDISHLISKETFASINSLSEMFINTNEYIPFPPGLYVELSKWPSFLSLIWGMFSGLDKSLFKNNMSFLNKRTEIMIEPLLNDINIKTNPNNKVDINIPIHNLVTVVIPKMLVVGVMLKNSLLQKK